ncbi:cytochrome b5-like heme/steroid binding domain-containing protein [Obelidium mucronatum]|nr:cytochrome b5-like heme/steroid binding domain-containing protein [Obelidium mucronatum]
MSKTFTWADVQSHNTRKSCWLVIDKDVFDCTKFLEEHPGGEEVMMENAGFDATDAFEEIGHSDDARDLLKGMKIGTLVDSAKPPSKNSRVADATSVRGAGSSSVAGPNWAIVIGIPIIAVIVYYFISQQ